jgi:hypothetical protein
MFSDNYVLYGVHSMDYATILLHFWTLNKHNLQMSSWILKFIFVEDNIFKGEHVKVLIASSRIFYKSYLKGRN